MVLIFCVVFLTSDCGNMASSSNDAMLTLNDVSTPAASPASSSNLQNADEYVLTELITVENGKNLTLKLHGKKLFEESGQYGIRAIDVFDGETQLQTIFVHDAIAAYWDDTSDYFDGYTETPLQDGGFTRQDMNFDGSEDIGLIGWITTGANIPYYYWLWNEDKQQFEYAFTMCNAEVDMENQQLISCTQGGSIENYTDYYQYDENGLLQNTKRIVETWGIGDEDGEGRIVATETYELIDGELQNIN